jgi:hypothetical protein
MQATLGRYRVSSQTPVYYYVTSPRILDACVDWERLPAGLDFGCAGYTPASERWRVARRILEHAFPAVTHHLSTPPEGRSEGGRRSVRLWDLLEFSVADDGTDFRLEHLSRDPEISRCRESFDLTSPISPYACTTALDPVFAATCRELGLSPGMLPGPRGDLARTTIARTFRHYVDWNGLRRSVLRFLAPDPLVLSLAHRIFDGDNKSIDRFNWVARHVRELSLVGIERPKLLPFLRFASATNGSPIANFDRIMAEWGMTPSARRKLEQWRFTAFEVALENVVFDDCEHMLAWIANMLDRLKVVGEADPEFCYLAWSVEHVNPPDWYLRALLMGVDSAGCEDYVGDRYPEFLLTAQWIGSAPPEPDENQKRAGWPWIVARAREYDMQPHATARQPWRLQFDDLKVDEFDVVAIRDFDALREEGDAMRNCLARMVNVCRGGWLVVFSIRLRGERLANFTLSRVDDRPGAPWQLKEIAGMGNRPAGEEITQVAMRAVEMLNAIPRAS